MQDHNSDVGYGRPPRDTQFKRGESGNPRGRPKGAVSFKSDLADELSEMITVGQAGSEMRVSKRRAIVKSLVAASVAGDTKAATALINLCAKFFREEEADPHAAEDEAFMEKLAQRELRETTELSAVASSSTKETTGD